jgi:hypothetical protein
LQQARSEPSGAQPGGALAQSREALAFVLREIGHGWMGDLVAIAAGLALPSVILMMMFGQTRIFFVMSRDGLLPAFFSKAAPEIWHAARGHHLHRDVRRPVCRRCFRWGRLPTSPTRAPVRLYALSQSV